MISKTQMKAARLYLGWDQRDLAAKAKLSLPTIQRMERLGLGRSTVDNAERVQGAMESAGIEFLGPDSKGEGLFATVNRPRAKARK